jgi:hypothetical protein
MRDGIDLGRRSVPWLNRRGHLGLSDDGYRGSIIGVLERIYLALGGVILGSLPLPA